MIATKTAVTDYLPQMPPKFSYYDPLGMLDSLIRTGDTLFNAGVIIIKVGVLSTRMDPKFIELYRRVDTVSINAFSVHVNNAYNLHFLKIAKDSRLSTLDSFQDDPTIQSITEEVKKLAAAAFEQHIECHQRMFFGGFFKQYCGIISNPDLHKSKYICVGPGADKIETPVDAYKYMVALAPKEITTKMKELHVRGVEAKRQKDALEITKKMRKLVKLKVNAEIDAIKSTKEYENYLRIHKYCMEVVYEIIRSFRSGTQEALSSNRDPVSYPYTLLRFSEHNVTSEQLEREKITDGLSVITQLREIGWNSHLVDEYEKEHGELKI